MIPSEKEQFEEESHLGTCKLEFNFIKTDIHKVCSMALELIKVLVISEYIFDYELQWNSVITNSVFNKYSVITNIF